MASYYIDSIAGSDSNGGTTTGTAWKTISRLQTFIDANSPGLVAGDTVYFKCNGYYPGTLVVKDSGAAGNLITYTSYSTGRKPILDAQNITVSPTWSIGDWSNATHHWVVNGLTFVNAKYYSINIENGVHDVEIKNCEFYDTSVCITIGNNCYNVVIHDNYFHDLRMVDDTGSSADYGAVGVNIGAGSGATTSAIEVYNNRMVRCRTPSLAFGHDGSAFEFHLGGNGIITNINCHHNYVEATDCFMEAGGDNGGSQFTNITFAYNVVVRGWGGMQQIHNAGSSLSVGTISSVNYSNNFYMADPTSTDVAIWFGGTDGTTAVNYRNNIFVMNSGVKVVAISGGGDPTTYPSHSYNIFYGNAIGLTLGTGDVNADPAVIDLSGGNYHLQASGSNNTGTNLGFTTDFDGNAVSNPPRKGPYEYIASILSATPSAIASTSDVPNSGRGQFISYGAAPWYTGRVDVDYYTRYFWKDLETTQGNYIWTQMDADVAQAAAAGGRFTCRIETFSPGSTSSLSYGGGYIFIPTYVASNSNGWLTNDGTYNYWVPDWNNSNYITRFLALTQAIASRYANNAAFGGFDISGYGSWGEWNLVGIEGNYPGPQGQTPITDGNAATLVNTQALQFYNKQLVMVTAQQGGLVAALKNYSNNIGIRADSLGALTSGYAMKGAEQNLNTAQSTIGVGVPSDPYLRWMSAPFVTEWADSTAQGNEFSNAVTQVTQFHVSTLSSHNWIGWDAVPRQPNSGTDLTNFEAANNNSGYRLRISRINLVRSATGLQPQITWTNDGVAPPYLPWTVYFRITGPSNVEQAFVQDLRTVLPGSPKTFTENMAVTLNNGTYSVYVRVVDSQGISIPMTLAQTSSRDGSGNYLLGTFDNGSASPLKLLRWRIVAGIQNGNFSGITTSPTAISVPTDVPNSFRGQYQWEDQVPTPVGSGRVDPDYYKRWNWWELEGPTAGDYSRGAAAINSYLASASSAGGRFFMRIIPMDYGTTSRQHTTNTPGGAYSCLPEYMTIANGYNVWNYGGWVIPDWNNSNFIARWKAFLDWMITTYGSNLLLAGLDSSFIGNWGEGHMAPPSNQDAPYSDVYASAPNGQVWFTDANQQDWADYHASKFAGTGKFLLWQTQPRAGFKQAMGKTNIRIGIRNDAFGQSNTWSAAMSTLTPDFDWLRTQGGSFATGQADDPYRRWETAPFAVEYNSYTELPQNDQAGVISNGLTQVQNFHVSLISSGNFPGTPTVESGNLSNFNETAARAGFRLRISNVSVSFVSGGLSVALTWVNDGVAPMYLPHTVHVGVTGATTAEATFTQDLRTVMPGTPATFTETFTQTFNAGSHNLYVRVDDNAGISPPLYLCQNTRSGNGSYPLGTFTVS